MSILTHPTGVVRAAWETLTMASPYILFGLFAAGLMRAFVKPGQIAKYLGGNDLRSVGLAAVSGVPLPLCSCGVVPTAMGLRQQGASKPATVAFLISTPESGIDSIAVTYALLGPFMAIIRPVAAFLTAFVAGVGQVCFGGQSDAPLRSRVTESGGRDSDRRAIDDIRRVTPVGDPQSCQQRSDASDGGNRRQDPSVNETAGRAAVPTETAPRGRGGYALRLAAGLHYAFVDLLRDISGWFLLGILLGCVISYAVPESFIQNYLGTGWRAMLVMLAIGIPIYICASASTPIAAALIAKGMSPGAALVFLLAGPATNMASLPVLVKFLGKRAVAIYLGAIAVCSILIGMLVNALAARMEIVPATLLTHAHHPMPASVQTGCAIGLLLLIAYVQVKPCLQKWVISLSG
ncbi:MAG: SO_0444 family Cu/Zn efflux transporter [Deltaproteobacteria bacterium]|nr:SO_0444 family Cu/Zn efflux transporter [Deltaproteobacteria bacterium]